MSKKEKEYVDGLFYNFPHENAPEFVLASLSIQRDKFVQWLNDKEVSDKGYIKIDVKKSREGKPYCELNTYKGTPKEPQPF